MNNINTLVASLLVDLQAIMFDKVLENVFYQVRDCDGVIGQCTTYPDNILNIPEDLPIESIVEFASKLYFTDTFKYEITVDSRAANPQNAREFAILVETLIHELIHVHQNVTKRTIFAKVGDKYGRLFICENGDVVNAKVTGEEPIDVYKNFPWEKEAFEQSEIMLPEVFQVLVEQPEYEKFSNSFFTLLVKNDLYSKYGLDYETKMLDYTLTEEE